MTALTRAALQSAVTTDLASGQTDGITAATHRALLDSVLNSSVWTLNTVAGTSYTLVDSDAWGVIRCTSASAVTITTPDTTVSPTVTYPAPTMFLIEAVRAAVTVADTISPSPVTSADGLTIAAGKAGLLVYNGSTYTLYHLGGESGADASGYATLGAVRLTKSSGQTISTASDTTVTWATEVMDPLNTFVVGTSATNINCPTGTAFIEVVAGGEWATSGVGTRQLTIKLNSTIIGQQYYEVDETSITNRIQVSSGIYPAVATDVITILAYQTSGGNLALNATAPTFVAVKFYG